jgi:hypothetical protein
MRKTPIEKITALLKKNYFLTVTDDPVKGLEDLLFEYKEMGKDHARMECLKLFANVAPIEVVSRKKKGKQDWERSTTIKFNGVSVKGKYVDDTLDKLHRKLHYDDRP